MPHNYSTIICILVQLFLLKLCCITGQNSGGMYSGGGSSSGGGGMKVSGGAGNMQQQGGAGSSNFNGMMSQIAGGKNLPPGYANIRGEIMDMSNKVLQRITAAGTNYFTYDNQNGAPIFRRREIDSGRRFVLMPDMLYPPGDGHFIVLRKMPGVNIPGMIPQQLYETFRLSLGDSVHAYVEAYKKDDQPKMVNQGSFNGLAASYGGQSSGYSMTGPDPMSKFMGKRKKRKSDGVLEMTPVDLSKYHEEDVVAV